MVNWETGRDSTVSCKLCNHPCLPSVYLKSDTRGPIYSHLFSIVGKVPVYCVGGLGSNPSGTNSRGLEIIDEKVLPLFLYLQMVRLLHLLG